MAGNASVWKPTSTVETDILKDNYQAIRDYTGTETTIYARGQAAPGDGGQSFFQYSDGSPPGTYVDNDDTTLVPTGGDGSAGWTKSSDSALIAHYIDTSTHGVGEILGTTEAQTLTNKTISAATNTLITAASGILTETSLNAALAQLTGFISTNVSDITANATAVALKAPLASPTFTGTVTTFNLAVTGNLTRSATTIDAGYITADSTSTRIGGGTLTNIDTASARNASAFGLSALTALTTGTENSAFGSTSLSSLTTGSNCTAGGSQAVSSNVSANYITGFGSSALASSTAIGNSGFGGLAGLSNTTGTYNTYIGYNSGLAHQTGTNVSCLGANSAPSTTAISNEITLGDSSIAVLRCQVTTITALSDRRDKKDIEDLRLGLNFINALRPVAYTWNMRKLGIKDVADTGFIAQELQEAQETEGFLPGLVYDANPERLEAGYGKLLPVLVKAIQELSARVEYFEDILGVS